MSELVGGYKSGWKDVEEKHELTDLAAISFAGSILISILDLEVAF